MSRDKKVQPTSKTIYKKRLLSAWAILILLAVFAYLLCLLPLFHSLGLSPLIIAVVFGAIFGNTAKKTLNLLKKTAVIAISTKQILRLGIIFYGFRITLADIEFVGISGIIMAFVVVFSTFFIGYFIGIALGLDKKSSALISAGSSICGAAAVLASESVVKGGSGRVGVAVCTVVVYGTIFMFAYPVLFKSGIFDFSHAQMGFFIGGTIHEVAHAVAAGAGVSAEAQNWAVIVKMLRVLMLVPFLIMLSIFSLFFVGDKKKGSFKASIPYFAIWFLVAVVIGSLPFFPRELLLAPINFIDTMLLSVAMVALGLTIRKDALKNGGKKAFILAGILGIWLIGFGFVMTKFFGI